MTIAKHKKWQPLLILVGFAAFSVISTVAIIRLNQSHVQLLLPLSTVVGAGYILMGMLNGLFDIRIDQNGIEVFGKWYHWSDIEVAEVRRNSLEANDRTRFLYIQFKYPTKGSMFSQLSSAYTNYYFSEWIPKGASVRVIQLNETDLSDDQINSAISSSKEREEELG